MNHRISAGALIVKDHHLLLVNHKKPEAYDFWVAPGGGVIGKESLQAAAKREVKEETGFDVKIEELIYIEEFWQPEQRHCKFWYLGTIVGGNLEVEEASAKREHIVEARLVARDELSNLEVFPSVIRREFWDDIRSPVIIPKHLALHEMEFY